MTAPITKADFKSYFDRDFEFGSAKNQIRDKDIDQALAEAEINFNSGLFTAGDDLEVAFEYLTAHCLVRRINSGGGLNVTGRGVRSTGSHPISSKSAGPLSVGYNLPAELADDANVNQFMTTGYGQQYLQMIVPRLRGNISTVEGLAWP